MNKKGLGRGLGALISSEETNDGSIRELKINDIEPNVNQPRKSFDDDKLMQLAESIKQHGIVQPIIVKKEENTYRIIAGERRWRAARIAGLKTIPAILKDLSNKETMEVALIENLQREDLNPIEEAEAYERLMQEYNLTQEEVSNTVGKSRSAVANSVRLLKLDKRVRDMLISNKITSGHARALLSLEDPDLQYSAAKEIAERNLNVRDTEKLVRKYLDKKPKRIKDKNNEDFAVYAEIEEKFKNILGTKVKLITNKNRGKILIEYYSQDELDRIIELFENIVK